MFYGFDARITHLVNSIAGSIPFLDFLMIWISAAGVPILVLAVAIQWWRRLDRAHVRFVLVTAGLSFLVGLALNQIILLVFQRIRPYDAGITQLLISKSADPSFPSDHATAATAIAVAFIVCRMRWNALAFSIAAVLVMISRVYIGTHYVSDVLGGAATGAIAVTLVRLTYHEQSRVNRMLTSIL